MCLSIARYSEVLVISLLTGIITSIGKFNYCMKFVCSADNADLQCPSNPGPHISQNSPRFQSFSDRTSIAKNQNECQKIRENVPLGMSLILPWLNFLDACVRTLHTSITSFLGFLSSDHYHSNASMEQNRDNHILLTYGTPPFSLSLLGSKACQYRQQRHSRHEDPDQTVAAITHRYCENIPIRTISLMAPLYENAQTCIGEARCFVPNSLSSALGYSQFPETEPMEPLLSLGLYCLCMHGVHCW
jgi:hypothetical protein